MKGKISIFLIYLISFIYLEFLFRFLLIDPVFRISNINMILFVVFFAMLLFIVTKLFKEKANKFFFYIFMFIISVWFAAQYVVKGFFDFYISFSILQIADQVGDFIGKAVIEILKRIVGIIFIFMPFIISIILRKKISFHQSGFKKNILLVIICAIFYGGYYASLNIKKDEDYSAYMLYHEVNNPSLNIEKVGVLNTFVVDTHRWIFGFEEKIVINNKKIHKDDTPKEIVYEYNNLDIDFDGIITDNPSDRTVKEMTEYFKNETGTLQNEYTGLFKGKNLILFMAESFNEIALREELMPTLYKMANSSFVFDNYYTPTIYSTIGGEFQELSGLYANFSSLSQWRSGKNSFPMGIAKLFQNEGYNTYAYHNNSYLFQDRNVYLKNLGFDNFLACYNGLEKKINCAQWPQSDVEMINATYTDFIDSEKPFMVFYASVSGHAGYSWSNAMARKHRSEIEALNYTYSDQVQAYLGTQMELDDALEVLIEKLEEAGKLDDTVFVLVGDHYPYELTVDQVNEAASYTKDPVIEVNHSRLVIWNNKAETVHVNKVGSQIDVLPTVYNLFNLPYDSRLFIGHDILSTEPGLAMFADNSWVSDKGKYFSARGKFEALVDDIEEDYVKLMNQDVRNRITMSKYIMDKNYYKLAWEHLK